MLFNSAVFVFLFLPIAWIGYLAALRLPWARAGIGWLAVASIFFYGYWNPVFVPLLVLSILFNYGAGRLLDPQGWKGTPRARRAVLAAAIAANLAALGWYKYAGLISTSLRAVGVDVPLIDVLLPIGISFYTFTQIAYLVDTWAGKPTEKSFTAYVLFVTFFPHLIAGPVLHHAEMMPQFMRGERGVRYALMIEGLLFFALGLAKKVLIADSVAPAANRAFTLAESVPLGFVDSWFGALAYTVQIYFDFSGYSDMAIGLALLFGIRLPLNFNSPYKSTSIIEFWRCWHMTLSRFLRDYLYIPLGGGRHGPVRRQINLMITMLLGGLWHGASWTFVVWGGLHGLYLQANHAWRHVVERSPRLKGFLARHPSGAAFAGWTLTFTAVVAAWVFFRAESFGGAANMLAGMFADSAAIEAQLADLHTVSYIALGLAIAFLAPNSQQLLTGVGEKLVSDLSRPQPFLRGAHAGGVVFLIVALVLISVSWGTNEFIYFNF